MEIKFCVDSLSGAQLVRMAD